MDEFKANIGSVDFITVNGRGNSHSRAFFIPTDNNDWNLNLISKLIGKKTQLKFMDFASFKLFKVKMIKGFTATHECVGQGESPQLKNGHHLGKRINPNQIHSLSLA